MRRFIIVVDDATPTQQDAISKHFQHLRLAFWHRFTDMWLVADPTDNMATDKLRDAVKKATSVQTVIVMKIDNPRAWSSFGNKGDFDWLKTEWVKE